MQEQSGTQESSLGHDKEALVVRFDPPAFLQRRAFVLESLRSLKPKCKSLLDVGTGDGGLLSFLVRCDDDLPITTMVGIDPDDAELEVARANTMPTRINHEDLRWRPLEIALYRGGVADLHGEPGILDCITAIEVLEHLDPMDVEALTWRCLGQLKPRCFIVTTPNRDFNQVFARLRQQPEHVHRRAGVDYVMRHSDHRFKMSRHEFEAWAAAQCRLYDYQVRFDGIGTVENAFVGQRDWRRIFPEHDLTGIFGSSTQAAIFTSVARASLEVDSSIIVHLSSILKNLHLITKHAYPWTNCDGYPPTKKKLMSIVARAETYFRPLCDSTRDYGREERCEIVIDCRKFFETCYAVQRVSRYHMDAFLACVNTMLNEEILSADVIEDRHPVVNASLEADHEPTAVSMKAEFRAMNTADRVLVYTFDINSFSRATCASQASDDSLSIDESGWNWSLNDKEIEPIEWH